MHLSPHVVVRSTLTVVRGLDAFQTENVGRSTCNADVNVLALSSPLSRSLIPNPGSLHHIPRTGESQWPLDRKSTRLNSSHRCISYAVFCLKKKKTARRQ